MYLSAVSGWSAASIEAMVGVAIGPGMRPGCVYVWKPASSGGQHDVLQRALGHLPEVVVLPVVEVQLSSCHRVVAVDDRRVGIEDPVA